MCGSYRTKDNDNLVELNLFSHVYLYVGSWGPTKVTRIIASVMSFPHKGMSFLQEAMSFLPFLILFQGKPDLSKGVEVSSSL